MKKVDSGEWRGRGRFDLTRRWSAVVAGGFQVVGSGLLGRVGGLSQCVDLTSSLRSRDLGVDFRSADELVPVISANTLGCNGCRRRRVDRASVWAIVNPDDELRWARTSVCRSRCRRCTTDVFREAVGLRSVSPSLVRNTSLLSTSRGGSPEASGFDVRR